MASIIKNNNLFCTCCGSEFKLAFPIPVNDFTAKMELFQQLHKDCPQTYVEPVADQSKSVQDKAMFWLNNGHVGLSSKTMWNCLMGNKRFPIDIPWDPDDFGRCYKLLETVPEWKIRLHEVAKLSPVWSRLVTNWDKLNEYYEDQVKNKKPNGMYEFMEKLIRP
jgi:hypothetical protein